jgi:hypothetical protein
VLEDDAIKKDSKKEQKGEGVSFGQDVIEAVMRARIRETIDLLAEEELEAALGAWRKDRGFIGLLQLSGVLQVILIAAGNTSNVHMREI